MLAYECPHTPLKISLPKNETMVNLKSATFVVIMLLHEGLTHIQSQIKPPLLFGESFTLIESPVLSAPRSIPVFRINQLC